MTGSMEQTVRATGRPGYFTAGAIALFLMSAAAAVLPMLDGIPAATFIGGLLLVGGLIEMTVGALRRETRGFAIAAGGVTSIAGLLFLFQQVTRFFPTVNVIIAWLLVRSVILIVASRLSPSSVRLWTMLSSAMDFLLAVVLIAGISIATVVVTLFGPTPQLVASFSWVLALSFVVTAALYLEVASCERQLDG